MATILSRSWCVKNVVVLVLYINGFEYIIFTNRQHYSIRTELYLTVTGEFPAKRPVTRSFDAFFDLRLNKRLSKQSWGWWFETPSRPLCRHCINLKIPRLNLLQAELFWRLLRQWCITVAKSDDDTNCVQLFEIHPDESQHVAGLNVHDVNDLVTTGA